MSDNDYYESKSSNLLDPNFLDNKWRVKLYNLNLMGQWDDMGTGYVFILREVNFLLISE
jgi:hypothetical protein